MSLACADHVNDHGPTGKTGHTGSDGSTPFVRLERYGTWQSQAGENIDYGADPSGKTIVANLVIDDGVANRGHRKNILTLGFSVCGVSTGTHSFYGTMTVIDYAGGFVDRGIDLKQAVATSTSSAAALSRRMAAAVAASAAAAPPPGPPTITVLPGATMQMRTTNKSKVDFKVCKVVLCCLSASSQVL